MKSIAAHPGLSSTIRLAACVVTAALTTSVTPLRATPQNVVVDWHRIGVDSALAIALPGIAQTRPQTILSVAINDALNGVTHEFPRFASTVPAPAGATPAASVIGAAYRALTELYPTQASALSAARSQSMAKFQVNGADPGLSFGESVAYDILSRRAADGFAQAQFAYMPPNDGAPGVWQPTPPAFLPASFPVLRSVQPWVLNSGAQFRPDEGPDLLSERYTADFLEIKSVGALNSLTRTAEQTNIAKFWLTSPNVVWGGVLGQIAIGLELDESETARDFAVMNM